MSAAPVLATLNVDALTSVNLTVEAVSDDSLGVVVGKVTQEDHVDQVCAQDSPLGVIEASNPWLASDVVACSPHEEESNSLAGCSGCNVVACERRDLASGFRDEPHLGTHCNRANEEARHPQGVEDAAGIHVGMEE